MLLLSRFGMSRNGKTIIPKPSMPIVTGPGPTGLIYGDTEMGFFGEVPSSSFISGSALASAIGLTTGSLMNNTTVWLKFILDGKILFIPKLHIRYLVSWQAIYQAGAVYGDGTNGTFPAGANRLQNAAVTIGGEQFTVQLLKGTTSENIADGSNIGFGYDTPITYDSEWNRLFYPLSKTAVASTPTPTWNLYTDSQLDIANRYSWCREKNSADPTYRVSRGYLDVSYLNKNYVTFTSTTYGWRPCLILQ